MFNCFDGYHMGRGVFIGNGLIGILFIALISIVLYMIFKNDSRRTNRNSNDALKILDTKFINGELTEEEYMHRKKLLKK